MSDEITNSKLDEIKQKWIAERKLAKDNNEEFLLKEIDKKYSTLMMECSREEQVADMSSPLPLQIPLGMLYSFSQKGLKKKND